ncbi:MAG: hypothetical protein ABW166_15060 [Sedimenticola sp.]
MNRAGKQIKREILGKIRVVIKYTDLSSSFLTMNDQQGCYYIKLDYSDPRKINKEMYDDLKSKFTNEQKYNADPEIIDSNMTYAEFYNKYFI